MSEDATQTAFKTTKFKPTCFVTNPEPRCPVVILADTSRSMAGQPISELNAGLKVFKNDLIVDSLAMKRAEICIMSFGPVKIEIPFQLAREFSPPEMAAFGDTPAGEATIKGIEMVEERKNLYKSNGLQYFRPWIVLLTDGKPTDDWAEAARRVHEGEAQKKFAFFAVGVGNADMDILRQISFREPLKLSGLKFQELFLWLSSSAKAVAASTPGDSVPLPSPKGWTEI